MAASAIIIAGSPLSQVATPRTPRRVGSERMSRRKTWAASLRYGQAVHHPDRALGPAVARVGDEAGERQALQAAQLVGGRFHQEADLPVSGVVAEGDRPAVGRADAALGRQDQVLRAPELPRIPAHAGVLGPAEEIAARPLEEHLRRQREAARRARRPPSGRREAPTSPSGCRRSRRSRSPPACLPVRSSGCLLARIVGRRSRPSRRPGQCTRSPSPPAGRETAR